AEIALGVTVFGASNVFTLSTLGAVNVSPVAELTLIPEIVASISIALFGSTLVSSSQSFPDESFAAIASTRGSVMSPLLNEPALKVTGTNIASWNGTYSLNT